LAAEVSRPNLGNVNICRAIDGRSIGEDKDKIDGYSRGCATGAGASKIIFL
jgi:hypothetical protein